MKMTPRLLLLLLPILSTRGANFVDICTDSSGNKCCAEGMENSGYWVMQTTGSWTEMDIECRLESSPNSKLVVFENRAENDCLIKYLTDEYRGDAKRMYAIGLKSPDDYKGVYEWRADSNVTLTFENWATGYPKDNAYVYMSVGVGATQNGKWTDTTSATKIYGICERSK